MKIVSVKINNILSIEDAYVEFDSNGLMLVQGWNHDVGRANGAGKTAIFNAITFALYDKLPRKITATEILRRGCKAGNVDCVIDVNGDRYMVRRSRPNRVSFFRFVTDTTGQSLDKFESLTITQEEWESKIKLNYTQFIISMYCAQSTSTRFLSINDADKKQFLLQLLNLEEFSSCKTVADKKVKSLEEEDASLKSKIEAAESKIDAYSESLVDENIISHHISLNHKAISDLTQTLIQLQQVLKPDLSKYQKLEEDISVKRTDIAKSKMKREMLHEQYKKLNSKIKPFNASSSCMSCGARLDNAAAEATHNREIDIKKAELVSIKGQIDECEDFLVKENQINEIFTKLKEKKKEESKEYESAQSRLVELQAKITIRQQELKELNLKLGNNSELQSKIKVLSESRDKLVNSRAIILRDIELYKTISAMYSPTGAQAYILDSVIESFNERVVEYVNLLWSNLTYTLQSYKENVRGDVVAKFSETLIMDGKSISIGSLSGGEMRALSLCVDFALVDVMERQFGISLSPIILDEPFDGLDGAGRELIISLLEEIATRRQVVVVDHASEVKSMFSKVLSVDKKNGISQVSLQA